MNRHTFFAAATAGALSAGMRTASAQTPGPIRIAISPNDSSLIPVYAQELGTFTQAGLNVELETFSNANGGAQAVVAGAADIGIIDSIAIANAYIHGFPLAGFAGGCAYSKDSPTLVLVTSKSSAIHTARDLENQAVAVPSLKSLSASMTSEWLRVNGADPAKVKFLEMPFPSINTALERGTIVAALQGEPFLSNAKAEQRALGVPFDAMGKPFYINIYAASRAWLTANTALAHRLAAALYDTQRWANTHRADSAAIESRFTKIPLDVAQTMARNVFATSFDPQQMQPVLDVGARYQLIDRAVRAQDISATV